MVRHGHGVGLARAHFARELLASGELVRVFDVESIAPPHSYYVVYEKQVLDRPEVALLLQWMRDTFGNL
jgi:DNA-binding transcriptional LysR family regulator